MVVDRRLCDCGSGLRLVRCCRLDISFLPTPEAGLPLAPFVRQAVERRSEGALDEAAQMAREVLELDAGELEALSLLYDHCKAAAIESAAHALLRRIVQLHPNTVWATHELALALFNKGAVLEAETHARNGVRIAPENPQSHNLMGIIMTEANRPQVGEYHYRKVLELTDKRDPIVLANLAWNLKNQGRMTESRQLYEESVRLAPNILQTLLGWARMEEADRNFALASELLDRAEQIAPDNSSLLLMRAVLYGRTRAYSQALTVLDMATTHNEDRALDGNEWLEKGRLLDQLGRYDQAFEAFVEGKRLCREVGGFAYLEQQASDQTSRLTRFFSEARLRILPRAAPRTDMIAPIFVVGFPRSGTTLVEQTLSAHPRVSAGDELPFVNEITEAMVRVLNSPLSYPEALSELWMGDKRLGLDELRDYYLARARQSIEMKPGAVWFTDKMPLNETHLGLVALLFPQSPIIHVLRHPLDVVLSTFSNNLTHGFYCSFELESVARHYALTMDLVKHYRTEMLLRYMPVRYEDIIDDQEGTVRRMLDFIGEPFDAGCLAFHQNRRYARTASYAQVTERLYDRSRFRYRHYRKHLEPVIPILERVIHDLGYPLD